MLCSVLKHLGSGRALKKWGKTLDCFSCFPLHFFRALPLPACFTKDHSTVEASLFVKYYLEYGCHLARLLGRRAYAPTSNAAGYDNHEHEKINSWISFSFRYAYSAPLGGGLLAAKASLLKLTRGLTKRMFTNTFIVML